MKNKLLWIIKLSCVTVFAMNAEATTFLSNLSLSHTASEPVASDSWRAALFRTGTNSGGYNLTSITLSLGTQSGNASGLSLSVRTSLNPTSTAGELFASEPTYSGNFEFLTSAIHLEPSTFYILAASSTTSSNQGYFNWNITDRNASEAGSAGGWRFEGARYQSLDGVNWTFEDRQSVFQFEIVATPIPEPSSILLLGLGGSFLFTRLVRKSRSKALPQQ